MHPYLAQILRPPRGPDGTSAEGSPPGEPGAVVRLVRDGPVPRASCPHCGGHLELSTVGSRWQVRGPSDVADRLLLQLGTLEREELHVLVLNARNLVIDQVRVYQGNVSESVVRIGELFRRAVELHGSAILLVHNHPTGQVKPSVNDLHLTSEAIRAGQLLDIAVLDHLIVGGSSFASLRDYGIAFEHPDEHRAGEAAGVPPWRDPWLGVCKSSLQKAIRRAAVPLAVWSAEQLLAMPGGRTVLGRRMGAIAAEDVGGCWLPAVGRAVVAAQDADSARAEAMLSATAAGLASVEWKDKSAYWLCDVVWGGRHAPSRVGRAALTEAISTGDHREALAICLEAIQRRQWRSGERVMVALMDALAEGPELTREIGRWALWRQGLGGSGSEECLAAAMIAAIDRPDGPVSELPDVRPDPPTEPLKLPVWVFDGHTAPGSRAIARLAHRTCLPYQLLSDLVFDFQSIEIAPHELPSQWRREALELDGRLAGWGGIEEGARLWARLQDQFRTAVEDELRRSPQSRAAPHGWSQRGG